MSYHNSTIVAILGKDRVVGQALELLLRGADYDARYLGEPVIDKLGELLDGVQLLLLGPTLSVERRENLLDSLRGEPGTTNIPIIELITTLGETRDSHHGRHVMWPCKTEELVSHIGEILLGTGHPKSSIEGSPRSNGSSGL